MLVDDAAVVRGLVARWIAAEPDLQVVASVHTGLQAVKQIERADPHVVVLDVDMPELDGLSALPLLLARKRNLVVIMASTLTRRNAEISLKALALGATDYVPKPDNHAEITSSAAFRRELIEKIRQLGARRTRALAGEAPHARRAGAAAAAEPALAPAAPPLRPFSTVLPRALVVGASTGGPQALNGLVAALAPVLPRIPVLITQHMPPTFTTILGEHLARASGYPAREAHDGEPAAPGTIYLAPGGRHMCVRRQDGPKIVIEDGPPLHYCKPAVDPLFASAAEVWGSGVLALILTGMGHDGTDGARAIVAAGGAVIAQDEATSVVWGMPGSAAHAGLCSAILPLDEIAPTVLGLCAGARP
jgi:two-component system, chemotaxis family, protein-glutamate methylesterase/glutaminase